MVVLPGDVGVGCMLACSSNKNLIVRMYTDKCSPGGVRTITGIVITLHKDRETKVVFRN